ncbi:hypothetical protein [Methylocystis sp. B8]|uniref:hypothetical protein n=1 Tax=Methylocystis sp. B8 TaxID=544938 RepID=UPI0010FDB37D|nr:hypothetical protein [Methylocystis sp. B8]TLG75160.1 hypothetical protein FEV16_11670 [Methylocystis sp. B8]
MSTYDNDPHFVASLGAALTKERADGHNSAYLEDFAAAFTKSYAEGRIAYRLRCKAIIESPEAKGREVQAKHLALETDMTAEQAIALLRTMASSSSIGARAAETIISRPL